MFHHLLLCLPVWDTRLREDTGLVADFVLLGPVFLEALPVLCCVMPGPVNLLGCGDRCTLDCSFSAFSCKTRNVYLSSLLLIVTCKCEQNSKRFTLNFTHSGLVTLLKIGHVLFLSGSTCHLSCTSTHPIL